MIVEPPPLGGSVWIATIGLLVGAIGTSLETEESGEADEEVEDSIEPTDHEDSEDESG